MIKIEKVKKISAVLEIAAVSIAVAGLIFRATAYPMLAPGPGETYGRGDVIDFVFALALFLVSTLCAVSGVTLSFLGSPSDKRLAYRVTLVGILSFVGYELLHAQIARLM